MKRDSMTAAVLISLRLPDESPGLGAILKYWQAFAREVPETDVIIITNGSVPADSSLLLESASPLISWCHVARSRSKAENLNYCLSRIGHDLFTVFDADSRPDYESVQRGFLALVESDSPIVQGKKVVSRTSSSGLLHRLVWLENFTHYGNVVPSLQKRFGSAYCAGSNFYVHRGRLPKGDPQFPTAISEDILLSLEFHARDLKISYDPTLRCFEQPPLDLRSLFIQRRRWIWGWIQAMRRARESGFFSSMSWNARLFWAVLTLNPLVALGALTAGILAVSVGGMPPAYAIAILWFCTCSIAVVGVHRAQSRWSDSEQNINYWKLLPMVLGFYPIYVLIGAAAGISLLSPPRGRSVTVRLDSRSPDRERSPA